MDEIMKFITENWEVIAVLVPLIISLIANVSGGLQKLLVQVMLFAEKKANAEFLKMGIVTGAEKKEFVLNYVYSRIPKVLTPFINKAYLGRKLENIICDLRDIKDDGTLNASSEE